MLQDGLGKLSQCLKHHSCRANSIAVIIAKDSKATCSLKPVVQATDMPVPTHTVESTGFTVALCELGILYKVGAALLLNALHC